MMHARQIDKTISKIRSLLKRLDPYLFHTEDVLALESYTTFDSLYAPPADDDLYTPVTAESEWGAEKQYNWLRGTYVVPERLAGKPLFLKHMHFCGYEGLLFVNGMPYGNYATKMAVACHGNHYAPRFTAGAAAGESFSLAIEAYAGHTVEGCFPYAPVETCSFRYPIGNFEICTQNEIVAEFSYDLRTLLELWENLDPESFQRARITNCFIELHPILIYSMDTVPWQEVEASLQKAREVMAPLLAETNAPHAPHVGLIGHSHMDTAWLWEIDETIKKCARTYSNQMNLMDRDPDYTFMQSSAYHLKWMEMHYPDLFEAIKKRILEGRYEPNGGVYVESDGNIPGGEYLIRQFLWGMRYTREKFGYSSNAYFLPDSFGFSAALPQILNGCGIPYFLTTKVGWSDTNVFPYDTFYWEGIDGSRVFTHFNCTEGGTTPGCLIPRVCRKGKDGISQKSVTDARLMTFGHGDGGGGPEAFMLEMAKRTRDLQGVPRAAYTTVGRFMQELERDAVDPNVYRGELYLELHRGTYTNQHTIKRNNRKAEIALHNAELYTVEKAIADGVPASEEAMAPLMEKLLVNQFHDILPGTCIAPAHDRSIRETTEVIEKATGLTQRLLEGAPATGSVTVSNPVDIPRSDVIDMPVPENGYIDGYRQQIIPRRDGSRSLRVAGVALKPFETRALPLVGGTYHPQPSPFHFADRVLTTPMAVVTFDEKGRIASLVDKATGREVHGKGYSLNTFLFGEDVPHAWDNWDIDNDLEMKLTDCTELESFEPVADGEVEFRIRTVYRLSPNSRVYQDMVFYADSPRIDFETAIDWHDKHRFLKTVFDTSVRSDYATQEVQFGYLRRSTSRNNSWEQARFEVPQHKYTDLSETRFGVAVLNDCKYGVSLYDNRIALSLHKGGCKPDPRGDEGYHECVYSLCPHTGAFATDTVVYPAYALNNPVLIAGGSVSYQPPVTTDSDHVLIETIKPCEDSDRAFIVRLYECEGSQAQAVLTTGFDVKRAATTDMLEVETEQLAPDNGQIALSFRPFEIKTLKFWY